MHASTPARKLRSALKTIELLTISAGSRPHGAGLKALPGVQKVRCWKATRATSAGRSSWCRTCKEHTAKAGINPRTLTWRKSKLRDATGIAAGDAPKFVEVTPPCMSSGEVEGGTIEVEVGETRIVVRGRVDTEALARVLEVEGQQRLAANVLRAVMLADHPSAV